LTGKVLLCTRKPANKHARKEIRIFHREKNKCSQKSSMDVTP
jgi:hypothetical protein